MSKKLCTTLESWLAGGRTRIGEILVLKDGGHFVLMHHADGENTGGLKKFTLPADAREISTWDAAGEFRPLKTAPNLKRGWRMELQDISDVHLALDFFYPAMLGVWLAFQQGDLKPVHLRETAARQSGMYDVVKKITDAQADELAGSFCKSDGKCIKTILWKLDAETPLATLPMSKFDPEADQLGLDGKSMPLFCSEACNLLVAAARVVVKESRKQE